MNKIIATLASGLLALSAQAQAQDQNQTQMEPKAKPQPRAQAGSSATTPAIGQAVSGNNATAAGVSGTGLLKSGRAITGTAHGVTARQAAGIDKTGEVTSRSTAVVNVAPSNSASVNAQATNTTPPATAAADIEAEGGRNGPGARAEREIREANADRVKVPPGSRLKTEQSVEAGRERYQEERKDRREEAADAAARAAEKR